MEPAVFRTLLERYQTSGSEEIEIPELGNEDVKTIRKWSEFARMKYGIAPISTGIFDFVRSYDGCPVGIELASFLPNLDALIFSPSNTEGDLTIVLNKNKPLIKQVFATAHELYHLLVDLPGILARPMGCDLGTLSDQREKCASRFAAEFLLPQEALVNEIERLEREKSKKRTAWNDMDIAYAAFHLSIKYGLPIRASLMRIVEEGMIRSVKKRVLFLTESALSLIPLETRGTVLELFDCRNPYVEDDFAEVMADLYRDGLVSRYQVVRDSEALQISPDLALRGTEPSGTLHKVEPEDDDLDELADIVSKIGR